MKNTRTFLWLLTAIAMLLTWPPGVRPAAAQDEPGVTGDQPPLAPPPQPQQPAPADDPVAKAETECADTSRPCPHFAALLRAAHDPQLGPRAVTLLGRLGEARAASTIAQVAVYGSTEALRRAAKAALAQLARSPEGRQAIEHLARDASDPTVRAQARMVVGAPSAGQAADSEGAGAGGGAGAGAGQDGAEQRRAQRAGRMIYGPTALSEAPGSVSWSVYNIALHTLDYTVNEHVEVGIGTVVPVAIYGVLPRLKLSIHPTDSVHLGLQAIVPVFGIFVENAGGIALFGGGPILTIGNKDLLFNASMQVLGAKGYGELLDDTEVTWVGLPNFGFSWQASRWIRLNLEAYVPIAGAATEEAGKVWLILYGIRITGQHLFADITFGLPLFPDCGEILQYMPIGYPLLSLGYEWH